MSLSSTSLAFLRDVKIALENVQGDGRVPPFDITYLIGNGGSAAVAEHIANDLVKHHKHAYSLTNPSVITCIANDLGYENVYREQIKGIRQGTLIAISSSGRSANIINAVALARSQGMQVITCSGFAANNPLRPMGQCNFWVPSYNYGVVECTHLAILHSIVNPGTEAG